MLAQIDIETVFNVVHAKLLRDADGRPEEPWPGIGRDEPALPGGVYLARVAPIPMRDMSLTAVALVGDFTDGRGVREAFRVLGPGGILYTTDLLSARQMLLTEQEGFTASHAGLPKLLAWCKEGTYPMWKVAHD